MDRLKVVKILELLPALGFILVIAKKVDLITGTVIVIALSTCFVLIAKILRVPLSKFQYGTWVAVVVFGSLTIFLQDELFIKLKTTIINCVIALAFFGSHFFSKKTLVEHLVASHLNAPAKKLRHVNLVAVVYFLTIALSNYWVSMNFSNENWAMFKVVGISLLNLSFISGVLFYLRDHLKDYLEKIEKK